MNNQERLRLLLDSDQFELVDFEHMTAKEDGTDARLIYLMNDTVESFLVFKNVRYTGTYVENFEGEISYLLDMEQHFLRVHQKDSHIVLFFDELTLENHFYDYGGIGHFWKKGWEHLRNLEFQIAVIRDKLDYLGEGSCNDLEKKIASLKNFPPLNYTCFPAVPERYIVPIADAWTPSAEAVSYFKELCREAEDKTLFSMTLAYEKHPTKRRAKAIAVKLTMTGHKKVSDLLYERISLAASAYPKRDYGEEKNALRANGMKKAEVICRRYEKSGVHTRIYREEPFVYDCDDITFHSYVMILKDGLIRRKVQVKEV